VHAADGLPHVFIGGNRHRAGVQHHQVGGRALTRLQEAARRQRRFQRRAIRLRGPASEILDEEFPHPATYYKER